MKNLLLAICLIFGQGILISQTAPPPPPSTDKDKFLELLKAHPDQETIIGLESEIKSNWLKVSFGKETFPTLAPEEVLSKLSHSIAVERNIIFDPALAEPDKACERAITIEIMALTHQHLEKLNADQMSLVAEFTGDNRYNIDPDEKTMGQLLDLIDGYEDAAIHGLPKLSMVIFRVCGKSQIPFVSELPPAEASTITEKSWIELAKTKIQQQFSGIKSLLF